MRLLRQSTPQAAGATVAGVSFSDGDGFGAVGAWEHRNLAVFAPRGISWRPCEGDRVLLVAADGAEVCAGALSAPCTALECGELRFCSAGGGEIHLKNTGDVVINGVVITRGGQILPLDAFKKE